MSWQTDQNYQGYSNYGGYSEGQTDSAIDMFDEGNNQNTYEQESGGFGGSGSAFYDPNAYTKSQTPSSWDQPQTNDQAYQRGPTPPNAYGEPAPASQFPPASRAPGPGVPPGNQPQMGIDSLMNNPMVQGMAMQYSQQIMGQSGETLKSNLDKYVSIGQLKYYFAVDTSYVAKKLGVLLFPFTRSDWAIKYNQDEPVQPKYDVNAPDLYIPTMAYATYVLLVGYILGLRNAFSPDSLATTASSALVWLILEIGIIYLTLTVMSINTSLTKWDILSFSSYKYVGIIVVLMLGLLLNTKGYYIGLIYVSAALMFFLLGTLKLRIEPEVHGMQVHGKRKLYIVLLYAFLQPLLIWFMTYSLVPISSTIEMPVAPPPSDQMPFQEP